MMNNARVVTLPPSNDASPRIRLGAVSYLNAKPLIAVLERDPRVDLTLDVPSRLPELLESGIVDAALVPVIDLAQRNADWQIVSDGCIGCDGETYTVRVFSRCPPGKVQVLHVDGDSHTSVALAKIIWAEAYGRKVEIRPFRLDECIDCEAVLLIGDKVVSHGLIDFDVETDLGSAWKSLTSLPFVFAVWARRRGAEVPGLTARLEQARDAGVAAATLIAEDYGPGLGWPVALARRYLTTRLQYVLGTRQQAGLDRFIALARKHGLIPRHSNLVRA